MIDKVVASADEAVRDVSDGSLLVVGGFSRPEFKVEIEAVAARAG